MYGSFVRFKLYKNKDVKAIKRLRMYIYDSMKKIKGIGYPKVFLKLKVIKNKYIIDTLFYLNNIYDFTSNRILN